MYQISPEFANAPETSISLAVNVGIPLAQYCAEAVATGGTVNAMGNEVLVLFATIPPWAVKFQH